MVIKQLKKKGFTLIELLAVIVILAVLAMITVPIVQDLIVAVRRTAFKTTAYSYSKAMSNKCSEKVLDFKNTGDGVSVGDEFTFSYTAPSEQNSNNPVQIFEIPADGIYQLETWGAQGGYAYDSTTNGGYGGYSTGEIELKKGDILYVVVGGQGTDGSTYSNTTGGYNGGADGKNSSNNTYAGAGGGATHIATANYGELKNYSDHINDILMVAGGGGGASHHANDSITSGGSAGGYQADSGSSQRWSGGGGGSQTEGGARATTSSSAVAGSFGLGGAGAANAGGGGGAGYYGGGGGHGGSGGGGSSYIANSKLSNKAMFCYGCAQYTTTANLYTISTLSDSQYLDKTNCPNGFSTIATSKCAKAGNGYAKITIKSLDSVLQNKNFSVISKDKTYQTEITLDGYIQKNNADSFYGNSVSNCDNEIAVYSRSLHLCAYKRIGNNEVVLINNTEEECKLETTGIIARKDEYKPNHYATDSTGYLCSNASNMDITDERYFTFDQATGTITGYSADGPKDVVIPCKIGGVEVTTIGVNAFNGKGLTSVLMPDTIKSIKEGAFYNNSISRLEIGRNVEEIRAAAFQNNKLTTLIIPDSVKTIGYRETAYYQGQAFMGNPLTSVTFGSGIETLYGRNNSGYGQGNFAEIVTLNEVDFSKAVNLKTIGPNQFYNTSLIELDLSNTSVETIGFSAFQYTKQYNSPSQSYLESVILPNTLKSIGSNAFNGQTALTELEINGTDLAIGSGAFQNCGLENITWTGKVTSIASDAFKNNQLPDSQAFIMCRNADGTENSTLCSYGGANRSNITISDNVTSLANATFNGLGLTGTLNTGNGVTAIEDYKFESNSLTNVIIGNSVKTIGGSSFQNNKIETLTLGESLEKIYAIAFYNNKIKELVIPDSVNEIGAQFSIPNCTWFCARHGQAFKSNPLTSVTFGRGLVELHAEGDGNFLDDSTLTTVDFSKSTNLVKIGAGEFNGTGITGVELPGSLTTIGNDAFNNSKLTYIEIPSSVMTVGSNVFANNSALEEIFVRGKVDQTNFTSAGSSWNGSCSNVVYEYANCYFYEGDTITGYVPACPKKIEIPSELGGNTITTIASEAFKDIGITQVYMPSTITTIGADAFSGNTIDPIYVLGKSSESDFTSVSTNWNNGAKVIYENTPQTCLKISENELTGKYDGYFCNDYKNIVIPNTVISIADNALKGYILDNITLEDGIRISSFGSNWNGTIYKPTFLGDSKEYNCYTLSGTSITGYKQFCPATVDLSETIMGTTIDSVASNAFKNAAITDLKVTSNIQTIGNNAFEGNDIEEIDFEEGITTIGSEAFKNIGLTRVTIPSSVTTIGSNAFADNPRITEFYVDGKESENDFASVGSNWNGGHTVTYKGN